MKAEEERMNEEQVRIIEELARFGQQLNDVQELVVGVQETVDLDVKEIDDKGSALSDRVCALENGLTENKQPVLTEDSCAPVVCVKRGRNSLNPSVPKFSHTKCAVSGGASAMGHVGKTVRKIKSPCNLAEFFLRSRAKFVILASRNK